MKPNAADGWHESIDQREPVHDWRARQLARLAARYAIEVERHARGQPALPDRGADAA